MSVSRIAWAAFAVAVVATPAVAQPRLSGGPLFDRPALNGPGPGWRDRLPPAGTGGNWGYYGLSNGPSLNYGIGVGYWGWGVRPAGVGGFWSNGLSAYGPPVPTYGPVPGSFGGGDAHRNYYANPPLFGYGLTYFGYRSPSPRLANPTVQVYPPGQEPPPARFLRAGPSNPKCARLEVTLPHPDADVWLNNTAIKGSGAVRAFESPELADGKTYEYEVVARWQQDGKEKAESRKVTVTAGTVSVADFTK